MNIVINNIDDMKKYYQYISPELKNNPKFMYVLTVIFKMFNSNNDQNNNYSVKISEDGKTITIAREYEKVLADNIRQKIVEEGKIMLNGDKLVLLESIGELEAITDYAKRFADRKEKEEFLKQSQAYNFNSMLHTWYEYTLFDQNGIQLQRDTYFDKIAYCEHIWNFPIAREVLTDSHQPSWDNNGNITYPSFNINAGHYTVRRNYWHLGVAEESKTTNISRFNTEKKQTRMTRLMLEYPDLLQSRAGLDIGEYKAGQLYHLYGDKKGQELTNDELDSIYQSQYAQLLSAIDKIKDDNLRQAMHEISINSNYYQKYVNPTEDRQADR